MLHTLMDSNVFYVKFFSSYEKGLNHVIII
jgi:hypothetical protein